MRARVRYAKTGKLRFVSAIDLGRLWERALRKADLPIAYSEGFSPHPKVSFTDALPLGPASTGEYAELTFAAPVDVDDAARRLNLAFPDGLAVLAAVEAADGDQRLARLLEASCWDLRYADSPAAAAAALAMAAADSLVVQRERKGQAAPTDVAPALHTVRAADGVVRVIARNTEPPVRPTELHLALSALSQDLPDPTLTLRVAQGRPVDEGLLEALSGELIPAAPATTDFPMLKESAST